MNPAIREEFEAHWLELTRGEDAPAPGDALRKQVAYEWFGRGWLDSLKQKPEKPRR